MPTPAVVPEKKEKWRSGAGMVHPSGGYDTIVEDVLSGTDDATTYVTEYLRDGEFHRENGPARIERIETPEEDDLNEGETITFSEETASYYRHGKLHRLDGPAIETASGYGDGKLDLDDSGDFYIDGVEISAFTYEKVADAVVGGSPLEWAIAYAEGAQGD